MFVRIVGRNSNVVVRQSVNFCDNSHLSSNVITLLLCCIRDIESLYSCIPFKNAILQLVSVRNIFLLHVFNSFINYAKIYYYKKTFLL